MKKTVNVQAPQPCQGLEYLKTSALLLLAAALFLSSGCAGHADRKTRDHAMGHLKDRKDHQIIRTSPKGPEIVSFQEMMDDLSTVRIIYVGENHRQSAHHRIQLKIIKALHARHPGLKVGMEMFAQPYQSVLDDWSAGRLSREDFIRATHWRANWKFDYELYAPILAYIQDNGLPLIALNIPFHIPPKIAVGGVDSLLPDDRIYLPKKIKTNDPNHRAYIKDIYDQHHQMIRNRGNFEDFYMAQNVWEDAMAESAARELEDRVMVVLAGNGHLIRRFGVPERAFARTGVPYRTVLPDPGPVPAEPQLGDYVWRTKPE